MADKNFMKKNIFPKVLALFFILIVSCELWAFEKLKSSTFVSLPSDMYYKPGFISQWWYFTGHLKDPSGNEYGFEQTFFVIGVSEKGLKSKFGLNNLYISHSAITDISKKRFLFNDKIDRGAYDTSFAKKEGLEVKVLSDSLSGNTDTIYLKSENKNFSFNLQMKTLKNYILNGENGYSNKVSGCEECASLYFSNTRLATKGSIQIDGKYFEVTGESWFDREINSDYDQSKVSGWDWFSVMFDDNTEMMLYLIRGVDGKVDPSSSGIIINPDSSTEKLDIQNIKVEVLDYYKSSKTGSTYPSKWRIRIPPKEIDIYIKTDVADQEFIAHRSTFNHYYEGKASVKGSKNGKAYVELTGY